MSEWLARLSAPLRATVVAASVFVLLVLVFVATGESIGSAIAQAAFWAILAVVAAFVGRALGARRRGGPGP
ncbi:MAG TPA: hypothetical protein VLZ06_08005 [Solirubrobacteraceae bacterium]|nr:hypothetical protein [Solirubrobacteraceae bacterium]